ncbi:MAG: hypothetical protein M3Y28_01155 [Armatimonadota bacterium]|nr:hypothetical protein [Armatimonadota bacterium]
MPNTDTGKAVSARNATTHGLFCRQTVLPHLGESPEAYKALLDALLAELPPRNLMEHQYLELWAEASWKLRRLSRWEAQVWEDDVLDDDRRLVKIERLARLQTSLRRQLDKSVQMLGGQHIPDLYQGRIRQDILSDLGLSEQECKRDDRASRRVALLVSGEYQNQAGRKRWPPRSPRPSRPRRRACASRRKRKLPKRTHTKLPKRTRPRVLLSGSPELGAGGASSGVGAPFPALRDIQTFTVRGPAPSPTPDFKQFARACAKRE